MTECRAQDRPGEFRGLADDRTASCGGGACSERFRERQCQPSRRLSCQIESTANADIRTGATNGKSNLRTSQASRLRRTHLDHDLCKCRAPAWCLAARNAERCSRLESSPLSNVQNVASNSILAVSALTLTPPAASNAPSRSASASRARISATSASFTLCASGWKKRLRHRAPCAPPTHGRLSRIFSRNKAACACPEAPHDWKDFRGRCRARKKRVPQVERRPAS